MGRGRVVPRPKSPDKGGLPAQCRAGPAAGPCSGRRGRRAGTRVTSRLGRMHKLHVSTSPLGCSSTDYTTQHGWCRGTRTPGGAAARRAGPCHHGAAVCRAVAPQCCSVAPSDGPGTAGTSLPCRCGPHNMSLTGINGINGSNMH